MQNALPIGNLRIGTCGWTEPGLIQADSFYPAKDLNAEERLRFYASNFPIVEVDSTFYAPPSEQNSHLWVQRTPDHFEFDVKALGLFTQHAVTTRALPLRVRELMSPVEASKPRVYLRSLTPKAELLLWEMFQGALEPLADAGKLGAVLFQFPPWFTRNRKNIAYLESLAGRLPWPMAVEFRGGGWMLPDRAGRTLSLLEKLGFVYVSVDEPQGFASSTPPVLATTGKLSILRLHGRNGAVWEKKGLPDASHRFNYLYDEHELDELGRRAEWLSAQSEEVHVLFNNNFRDYHVRNARDFTRMMGRLRRREEIAPDAPLPQ